MSKGNKRSTTFKEFIEINYKRYAMDVLQNRAMPDWRDGLKPVNRKLIWTCDVLGLHNNKAHTKSAKVTGLAMAEFHPHSSAYKVLVNMSQNSLFTPLIDGEGNWGSVFDGAAAERYTECRLSKYSDICLLDKEYLQVTDMIPNYLGEKLEPVILPSLLPTLFLVGGTGIAAGYSSNIPTFSFESVLELTEKGLKTLKKGKSTLTAKDLTEILKFDSVDNKKCVSKESEILDFFKTGKGSIVFGSKYKIDKRTITFNSVCGNPDTMITKLENDDSVFRVNNASRGNDINIDVTLKPSIKLDDVKSIAKKLEEKIRFRQNFNINVIETYTEEDSQGMKEVCALLLETNLTDLINKWIEWRIALEVSMLKNRVVNINNEIKRLEFLRFVISKLDIIFKVLKSKTSDLNSELAKKLKISLDEAKSILDMPVRRLSKMSDSELKDKIKVQKDLLEDAKKWIKVPEKRILKTLVNIKKSLGF